MAIVMIFTAMRDTSIMMMGSKMKTKKKPISAHSKATVQMNRQVTHAVRRVQLLHDLYAEMIKEKAKQN